MLNNLIGRYLGQWNLVLLIIGGCSVLAVAFFIERLLFFKKSEVDTATFLIHMRQSIQEGNIIEAVKICETQQVALPNIIKAGLLRHERSKGEIEATMELTGLSEIAKLEKNAKILSLIAHIAPLIGLLGTVLGFIQAFAQMRQAGLMDISANKIGEAMEYALVTTAAGLVVAIPSIVGYNYLVSRIKAIVLEIQTISSEVVDLLMRKQNDEI